MVNSNQETTRATASVPQQTPAPTSQFTPRIIVTTQSTETVQCQIEVLGRIHDYAANKVAFLEQVGVTTTVGIMSGLVVLIWYTTRIWQAAEEKIPKIVATRICQVLPFVIAFYASFLLYTRTTAYRFSRAMMEVQTRMSQISGLGDLASIERNTGKSGLLRLPGITFYNLGVLILGGCYIWAVVGAFRSRDEKHRAARVGLFCVHIALLALLLLNIAVAKSVWRGVP